MAILWACQLHYVPAAKIRDKSRWCTASLGRDLSPRRAETPISFRACCSIRCAARCSQRASPRRNTVATTCATHRARCPL
eukprot:6191370-Pleurochrysis_carterae.AAC.3